MIPGGYKAPEFFLLGPGYLDGYSIGRGLSLASRWVPACKRKRPSRSQGATRTRLELVASLRVVYLGRRGSMTTRVKTVALTALVVLAGAACATGRSASVEEQAAREPKAQGERESRDTRLGDFPGSPAPAKHRSGSTPRWADPCDDPLAGLDILGEGQSDAEDATLSAAPPKPGKCAKSKSTQRQAEPPPRTDDPLGLPLLL
jgi:hypothetical protein